MRSATKMEITWLAERLPALAVEFAAYERMHMGGCAIPETQSPANGFQRISLRDADRERCPDLPEGDIVLSKATLHASSFPQTMLLLTELSTALCGDLGRARFMLLSPFEVFGPHKDTGRYHCHRDRYHLILCGEEGVVFDCEGDAAWMMQGELWWFNNRLRHRIRNPSSRRGIHLAFELLPPQTMWL